MLIIGVLLQRMSETFVIFQEWLTSAHKECGHVVKTIRVDKGGEFTCGDVNYDLMTRTL